MGIDTDDDNDEYFTFDEILQLRLLLDQIQHPTTELTTARDNLSNYIAKQINIIAQD